METNNTVTAVPYRDFVEALKKPGHEILQQMSADKMRLLDSTTCLMGEAGELFDGMKPHFYYGKPLEEKMVENAKEELGDILFYLQDIANQFGWSIEELIDGNKQKLSKRYKGLKYTDQAALNRADKAPGYAQNFSGGKD